MEELSIEKLRTELCKGNSLVESISLANTIKINEIVEWINEHEKRWDEKLVLMSKGTDPTPK